MLERVIVDPNPEIPVSVQPEPGAAAAEPTPVAAEVLVPEPVPEVVETPVEAVAEPEPEVPTEAQPTTTLDKLFEKARRNIERDRGGANNLGPPKEERRERLNEFTKSAVPRPPQNVVDVTDAGVPFLNVRAGQCKFPLWSDTSNLKIEEKMVCGRASPGKVWCDKHRKTVFEPMRKRG